MEIDLADKNSSHFVCMYCYNKINKSRNKGPSDVSLQEDISAEINEISNALNNENINMLCYKDILLQVQQAFQEEKPVLLSSLYK